MALWGRGDGADYGPDSGVDVNQATALRLIAVYACVRLISDTIAALPAHAYRKQGDERKEVSRPPFWLEMPNIETTWFEFVERCLSSLNLDGNAFIAITARDNLGFPAEFYTLHPRSVDVRREKGRTFFVWEGTQELSRFSPRTPMGDVLHIKAFNDGGLRGLSPIDVARQAIGLGLATERYGSRFFGKGSGSMPGVIQVPQMDQKTTNDQIQAMRDAWAGAHEGIENAHKPGILTGGATWQTVSISHEDAQFLDTRKFQVSEIARLFNVPPHLIQELDTTTSWGTGIEQQSIGFVRFSLLPWLVRLETSFNQLLPRGQFLKFETKGLERGDSTAQAELYAKAIQNGWLSRAQVRRLENEPVDDPELEKYLYPSNETLVGEPKPEPVAVPVNGNGQVPASLPASKG
jgi:HK97 family phage portal protein